MSHTDEVLNILAECGTAMSDADIARELKELHPELLLPRHTANEVCRRLAKQGLVHRDKSATPILNSLRPNQVPRPATIPPPKPWPSEDAVLISVGEWLALHDGRVVARECRPSKNRGADIVADLSGRRAHIQATGAGARIRSDRRDAELTHPTIEATQRFAGILLMALKLRHSHTVDRVIVALPDVPRYHAIRTEIAYSLDKLDVEVLIVAESGAVTLEAALPRSGS